MELVELQPLFDNYHRKIAKISLRFKRYLYSQINWESRFIGIKGARGVGKTTMLLQHILENYEDIDQTLYASLDDLWFSSHTLMDLVDWAYQHGIMRLYLDEVHRYDSYPDMSIIYTSSSLLIMDNAKIDLSRRQTIYTLHGMSFREFLAYEDILHIDAVSFEDLLRDKEVKVVTDTDDNGRTRETYYYYLYFEQIYGKYAKRMEVPERVYDSSVEGEKYYVGIINGKLSTRIYSVKSYELAGAVQRAVVTDVRALGKSAHWRWRAPEEKPVKVHDGVKQITPEQIVEDMYIYEEGEGKKKRKYSPIIVTLAVLAVILVLLYVALSEDGASLGEFLSTAPMIVTGYVIMILVACLPTVLIHWLSTMDVRRKKKEILARHYRVVLETVETTEDYDNGLSFRDIHRLMPIRLASGRAVNLNRASFNNVKPGDKLYVVYLESNNTLDNNSVVAVYQEKLGKLDFGFEVEWAS